MLSTTKIINSNRRQFLKKTGGISLALSSSGLLLGCSRDPEPETSSSVVVANKNEQISPNIWVNIAMNDSVTIQLAVTELGQGSMTAIPLILAEEMDADWRHVKVETLNVHDEAYGNPIFLNTLYTSGSTGVMVYYERMRSAGAQARKLLLNAASEIMGVAIGELETEPSRVIHRETGLGLSYGEIVGSMVIPDSIPEISESDFKPIESYRYIGKNIPRIDTIEKATGKAEYAIDVQLPNMLYASILRTPVEGDEPLLIHDASAREVEGVVDVVRLPDGVAVVGETFESSLWGKKKLDVTWSETSPFRVADTEKDLDDYAQKASDLSYSTNTPLWHDDGDVDAAFANADTIIEASYRTDPAYHAQMEPMNCVANVSDDGKSAEIWVGTQTQSFSIIGAAEVLGTDNQNITLHTMYSGGGYGRRVLYRQKYIDDALFTSRAVGRPVKVIWSREEDVQGGTFRPLAAQYIRAALDKNNNLVGWHQRVATPSVLEFINPMRWEAANGRDIVSLNGSQNLRYDIPNFRTEHLKVNRNSRLGAWRGVGTSYTKFASESFLDEVAHARSMDPLEMRLQLSHQHPRSIATLELVAEMAQWQRARDKTALGIAITGYGTGSTSAGIAEISLDESTGLIRVHNFWISYDAGLIISPDNANSQMVSNALFGIGNALKERITIKDGEVQQSNFHDYHIMRMSEMPEVEARAIHTDNPPTGIGELGIATTGAAIGNALFRLTGKRVRELPLTPERVLKAINT